MNPTTANNVCRLCANHGHNYRPIFDSGINSIVTTINNCLPITVGCNDQLPDHICNTCLEELNICDKLRKRCLIADSILRKQLKVVLVKTIKPEKYKLDNENETDLLDVNSKEYNAFEEHTDVSRFPGLICDVCEDEFKCSDDLLRHKNEMHCNQNEYMKKEPDEFHNLMEVDIANDDIVLKEEIILPSESMPVDIPISNQTVISNRCYICHVVIRDKELMMFHMVFHQPHQMKCDECNTTCDTAYEFYMHKKIVHMMWKNYEIKWFCNKCQTMIHYICDVKKHLKECIRWKYQCGYCAKQFILKKALLSHQQQFHYNSMLKDPNVEKFYCEFCGRNYLDTDTFLSHKRWHKINDLSYKCFHCGKIEESEFNLLQHIESIHNYNKEDTMKKKVFKCSQCLESFTRQRNLLEHERYYHAFTCTRCQKQFDNLIDLGKHWLENHKTKLANVSNYRPTKQKTRKRNICNINSKNLTFQETFCQKKTLFASMNIHEKLQRR